MRRNILFGCACLMMILTACSSASAPPAESAGANDKSAADMASLELVNSRTGEMFKLSDFAGKTVWVQPMATWCLNCRRQMKTLIDVYHQADLDKIAIVSLSVAENVDNQTVAAYADEQGFEWIFAIATPEMGRALIDRFGQTVVVPPTTPHFIIAPDGTVSDLLSGYQDATAAMALLNGA